MESALERRERIAERIKFRGQVNVNGLASEFDVCARTIRYDLVVISLSYPIDTVQGSGGGVVWKGKRPAYVQTAREAEVLRKAIKLVSPEDAAVLENMIITQRVREPFNVDYIFKCLSGGITQTALADRLGISKAALSNIMAGRRTPSVALSKKIKAIAAETEPAAAANN